MAWFKYFTFYLNVKPNVQVGVGILQRPAGHPDDLSR
jgi:hypothetical protein